MDNRTSGPVNTDLTSALQLLNPKTLMDGPGTGKMDDLFFKGEMHKKAYEDIWLRFFQFLTDFHETFSKCLI